jgi:hypothetical protein
VSYPAAALCRANAKGRWFRDDCRIAVVSVQAPRQSAIHTSELLVYYAFENEIAAKPELKLLDSLGHEDVHSNAGFHIVRATAINTITFD